MHFNLASISEKSSPITEPKRKQNDTNNMLTSAITWVRAREVWNLHEMTLHQNKRSQGKCNFLQQTGKSPLKQQQCSEDFCVRKIWKWTCRLCVNLCKRKASRLSMHFSVWSFFFVIFTKSSHFKWEKTKSRNPTVLRVHVCECVRACVCARLAGSVAGKQARAAAASAAVPTAEICNLPSLSTFRLSTTHPRHLLVPFSCARTPTLSKNSLAYILSTLVVTFSWRNQHWYPLLRRHICNIFRLMLWGIVRCWHYYCCCCCCCRWRCCSCCCHRHRQSYHYCCCQCSFYDYVIVQNCQITQTLQWRTHVHTYTLANIRKHTYTYICVM